MRLLFFRHGDPNYEIDGLTEKGKIEAELLAKQIKSFGIDEVFVSPLGRAKATADYSLKELGMEATTLDWLQEFPALFDANVASEEEKRAYFTELNRDSEGRYEKRIVWDMLPSYYGDHPELFDVNRWKDSDIAKASDVATVYDRVTKAFDDLLNAISSRM